MYFFKFKKHLASSSGFTLMEILMSLAIFGTAIVIIANIFVLAGRAQQKTSLVEIIQSDTRFVMESMVREIRAGSIDYDFYNNNINEPEDSLAIIDSNNDRIIFYLGDCLEGEAGRQCLKINASGKTADLTSREAEVVDLKFYISPFSDPFMPPPADIGDCLGDFESINNVCLCESSPLDTANCYIGQSCLDTGVVDQTGENILVCQNADIQPMVTIVLTNRGIDPRAGEPVEIKLQTTVSTKNYQR